MSGWHRGSMPVFAPEALPARESLSCRFAVNGLGAKLANGKLQKLIEKKLDVGNEMGPNNSQRAIRFWGARCGAAGNGGLSRREAGDTVLQVRGLITRTPLPRSPDEPKPA